MKKLLLFLVIVAVVVVLFVKKDSREPAPELPVAEEASTDVEELLEDEDVAQVDPVEPPQTHIYDVVFKGIWSQETHPELYDPTAHFSPFVAVSHNGDYDLFATGTLASPGIKDMAETGKTKILLDEIAPFKESGQVEDVALGSRFDSPGSSTATLEISDSTDFVSFVSMIAPSPDWFVGVIDVGLIEDGTRHDRIEIELGLYDAGTDSGTTFTAADLATAPQEKIHKLRDVEFASSLGYIELTRRIEE